MMTDLGKYDYTLMIPSPTMQYQEKQTQYIQSAGTSTNAISLSSSGLHNAVSNEQRNCDHGATPCIIMPQHISDINPVTIFYGKYANNKQPLQP